MKYNQAIIAVIISIVVAIAGIIIGMAVTGKFSQLKKVENSETIINSLFPQQDDSLITEEPISETKSEHTVDPDDYALYKKYLS